MLKKCFLKFLIVTITINLLLANSIYSQQPQIPEEVLTYSLLLAIKNGTGTGFFMIYKDFIYLVSARHVFYNQLMNVNTKNIFYTPIDSTISIAAYPDSPDRTESNLMMIDLKNKLWGNYVKYDEGNDIAAIQIGKIDTNIIVYHSFVNKYYKSSHVNPIDTSFCKTSKQIFIGNDVFIIGYPTSIGIENVPQIDILKPLLRKGIIAGKNNKLNSIILDCAVYPGNSGGPVFEYDFDYQFVPVKRTIHFIGIVTEFVPFTQEWKNTRHGNSYIDISNSGYSVVVPYDVLLNLLKQFNR